jgi:hypothetical protein
LPSLKAPAPEKPVVMAHGLQFKHFPVMPLGQRRVSIGWPFSIIRIFFLLPFLSSSSAVKIPAGPAPTIKTSYISFSLT